MLDGPGTGGFGVVTPKTIADEMAAIAGSSKGNSVMPRKPTGSDKGAVLSHIPSLRDVATAVAAGAGGGAGAHPPLKSPFDLHPEVPGPEDGLIKSCIVGKVGLSAALPCQLSVLRIPYCFWMDCPSLTLVCSFCADANRTRRTAPL